MSMDIARKSNLTAEQLKFVSTVDSLSAGGLKLDDDFKKSSTAQLGADVLSYRGVLLEGLSHYEQLIPNADGRSAKIFLRLGHLNLLLRDYPRALSAYQRHLHQCKDPDQTKPGAEPSAPFLYGLGLVYFHFHSLDWAYRVFASLLEKHKQFSLRKDVIIRLGYILKMGGDLLKSRRYLLDALQNPSKSNITRSELLFHLAHLDELGGDLSQAHSQYLSLVQSTDNVPNNVRAGALRQLGWLHHTLARSKGGDQVNNEHNDVGMRYIRQSLSVAKNDAQAWYYLSRILASQGNVREAFAACRQSIAFGDLNPNAWCSIGLLYHQQKQFQDALQAYTCALQINPQLAAAWLNVGILYEQHTQINDALACYQKAIETGGPNDTLYQRMEMLRRNSANMAQIGANAPQTEQLRSLSQVLMSSAKYQLNSAMQPLVGNQSVLLQANHLSQMPLNGMNGQMNTLQADPSAMLGAATATSGQLDATSRLMQSLPQQQQQQQQLSQVSSCPSTGFQVAKASNSGRKAKAMAANSRRMKSIDPDLMLSHTPSGLPNGGPLPITAAATTVSGLAMAADVASQSAAMANEMRQASAAMTSLGGMSRNCAVPGAAASPLAPHDTMSSSLATQLSRPQSPLIHPMQQASQQQQLQQASQQQQLQQQQQQQLQQQRMQHLRQQQQQQQLLQQRQHAQQQTIQQLQQRSQQLQQMSLPLHQNNLSSLSTSSSGNNGAATSDPIGTGSLYQTNATNHLQSASPNTAAASSWNGVNSSSSAWPASILNPTSSASQRMPADLGTPSPSVDFLKSLDGFLNGSEFMGSGVGSESEFSDALKAFQKSPLTSPTGMGDHVLSSANLGLSDLGRLSQDSSSGAGMPATSTLSMTPGTCNTPSTMSASMAAASSGQQQQQQQAMQRTSSPSSSPGPASTASQKPRTPGASTASNGAGSPRRKTPQPRTPTSSGANASASSVDFQSPVDGVADDTRRAARNEQSLTMRTQSPSARRPSQITDVLSPTLLSSQPRNGFSHYAREPVILKGENLSEQYSSHAVSELKLEYMLTAPKFIPPKMPTLEVKDLNPEVPTVEANSIAEAHSAELRHLCLFSEHPILLIKNCAKSCNINLELFGSKHLSENFHEHPMELRTQRFQEPEVNIEFASKRKGWRYHSSRSQVSIGKYYEYQKQTMMEAYQEAQDRRVEAALEAAGHAETPSKSSKKKKSNKAVKFGTNGDLSDETIFADLLAEVAKLPEFLTVTSSENILSYVGHTVLGMNSVQLYMKVPGCRTPAHQENNNFCSVNVNIGPGDCEWFAVPNKYWGMMHRMCDRRRLCFLTGSWWPLLDDLREHKIPVYRFTQKAGDIVWVNTGCVHWVQSVGFCNNIAWNVGPTTAHQYRMSMERYRWNKVQSVKSIVPMIHLSWNLARFVPIREPELHAQMKRIMDDSMSRLTATKERLDRENTDIKWHGHEKNEGTYYCRQCEVEVFNFLFTTQLDDKHVVFCEDCARSADSSLLTYCVLQQFELEDLQTVRDHFHLQPATPSSSDSPSPPKHLTLSRVPSPAVASSQLSADEPIAAAAAATT